MSGDSTIQEQVATKDANIWKKNIEKAWDVT